MSKKFAVFDIDGTLIRWQLYHAVTDNLVKKGAIDGERFETIRGARMDWKRRAPGASFRSYEMEVIKAYEQTLTKLTTKQLIGAIHDVFDEYKDQVYTYTRDLAARLKKEGYLLFAISGSQSEIVELISEYYRFDAFVGTEYESRGGRFTGDKVFHAQYKDKVLRKLIKQFNADTQGSMGVGDSKGDIAMLELVEEPVAFNPEKELFDYAKKRGWKVVLERKNMIYELERNDGQYILAKAD